MLTKQAFKAKYPTLNDNRARMAYHLTQVCCPSELEKTPSASNMGDLGASATERDALERDIIDRIDEEGNFRP